MDVDPDANLGLALGFPVETLENMIPISKMRSLIEERIGADESNTFYKVNPKVDGQGSGRSKKSLMLCRYEK